MRKETGIEQEQTVRLDLNEFKDSKDLLVPYMDKKVYISLSTARFEDLAKWYRIRDYQKIEPDFPKPMYGQVLLFDTVDDFVSGITTARYPESLKINTEYAGTTMHNGDMVTCNGSQIEVVSKKGVRILKHELFNDVKFVDFSSDGSRILVSASGTDSLLEFSYPDLKLTWMWHGPENGYDTAPDGTKVVTRKMLAGGLVPSGDKVRVLDDGTDFGPLDIATKSQTTHINSATYLDGKTDKIAATIFQTGDAVIIDKVAGTTQIVKNGLARPHGFYGFGGDKKKYVITSPTTGLIDILDSDYRQTHSIQGVIKTGTDDRTWLQNTYPVAENLLALVDHYNFHVVFFDLEKREKVVVETHKQWKIFQIGFTDGNK